MNPVIPCNPVIRQEILPNQLMAIYRLAVEYDHMIVFIAYKTLWTRIDFPEKISRKHAKSVNLDWTEKMINSIPIDVVEV